MLLTATRSSPLVFVGGKGGVGKTTVASALAYARAAAGQRVLLVSTDPAHNLGHLWERSFGDEALPAVEFDTGGVDALEISPEATVSRHLAAVSATMREILPERMHRQAAAHLELARNAPGSHEAAMLERVADLAQLPGADYDSVVFDTAPTGHTLRLLSLPTQLGHWVDTLIDNRERSERFANALQGLMPAEAPRRSPRSSQLMNTLHTRRERFARLAAALSDRERTAFVAVCVAEPVPVTETIQLADELAAARIRLAATVVNRRTPPALDGDRAAGEAAQVARLASALPTSGMCEIGRQPGPLSGLAFIAGVAQHLG
ncbi:ArsA family ATPase [Leucobacter albus]|uniref:ArsA family ATPase n=1 Tax=Leucobacter albus TaxID=272210 RepID=A0ABW3TLB4_9MICO